MGNQSNHKDKDNKFDYKLFGTIGLAIIFVGALVLGRYKIVEVNFLGIKAVPPSITPQSTITPTNTTLPNPTLTRTPINTLSPTQNRDSTSTSSLTLTPTPPYLFETSFDQGLPDGMQIVLGREDDIGFVDGKLVARNLVLFEIGEDDWKNYQIEYEAKKEPYCWGLQENGIAAHGIDESNMVMFSWNYCESDWFEIVNGDWTSVSSGLGHFGDNRFMTKIRLVAQDGSFVIYENDQKFSSYYNDNYLQGKAYILVSDSTEIDNIKVKKLP